MYSFCILFAIIKTIEALVASEARTNPSLNNTFDNSLGDWNSSLKATADNLWNPDTFSVSLAVPDPVIYKCNGSLFQFDLSVSSCMNALTTSVFEWSSPTPKTFGRRHTGVQYDFPLPVRFVSSEIARSRRTTSGVSLADTCTRRWDLHYRTRCGPEISLCAS